MLPRLCAVVFGCVLFSSVALAQPAGDADQKLELHGYVETQLKTAHISARGLVIVDKGVEIQPAGGFTFNLYEGTGLVDKVSATLGAWNSLNTSLDDPIAGPWFEIDPFAGVSVQFADRVNASLRYVAFDSASGAFSTDNNIECTVSYDDTGAIAPNFGFHPYARLFYNVSGSSTTVLGRNGNTYDVELGCVPAWVVETIPRYPLTLTFPTYMTVGPRNFWGGRDNVGIFTTTAAISVPLSFMPSRFGHWHIDAGATYFNLLNGKLVDAAGALGNGRNRNWIVGELGMGFDF